VECANLFVKAVAPCPMSPLFSPVMYAEVAFPISSYQTFTYQIPEELNDRVKVGVRVKAPLGRRMVQGVVVSKTETSKFKGKIRGLSALVDDLPVLDEQLWELLQWTSRYYLTPLGQVAKTAMPRSLSTGYEPQRQKSVRFITFGPDPDMLAKKRPAQFRMLEFLSQQTKAVAMRSLTGLVSNPLNACRKLAEQGLVEIKEEIDFPDATGFSFKPIAKNIEFSFAQQQVLTELSYALQTENFHPSVLHGVTGSGKTEIYIELVRETLEQGRTAIMLLPEIALTPQIAGRFRAVFGEKVALWHSKMTTAVRAWTWKQICAGQFKVVVGARSAIFSPMRNIGLIVVDEEQEQSYKQDSPEPRYHARDVALMRGKISEAVVVLASATPSLESYYNQIQGKYSYLYLSERFGGAKYPQVHIVDMNREQEETGKSGQVFSSLLLEKIQDRLARDEQIILLQNRRGYAPVIRCGDCGEILMCPNCHLSLTYHSRGDFMQCHFCGYSRQRIPDQCPACHSIKLLLAGTGTQKVEDILRDTFPQMRLSRLDLDTTRSGANLTRILEEFADGQIDILLGTQMIAKGLDFENATLVGIINGDTGLFLPDYRAGERVFQLIYQAAGRAGRHKKPGEVVIQTYNPEDSVIKNAARLDLQKYYNIALSERQELNYTPFSWMVRIEFSGEKRQKVETQAANCRENLMPAYKGLEILGPAPCYRERLRNKYRYQIVFKSKKAMDPNGSLLHDYLRRNFTGTNAIRNSKSVRTIIDIDPVSIL